VLAARDIFLQPRCSCRPLLTEDRRFVMLRSRSVRALGVTSLLFAAGQIFLLAVNDLTRASGTFARSIGIAILAPDSPRYLRPDSIVEVFDLPWTRWGYPLLITFAPPSIDAATFAVAVNGIFLLAAGTYLFWTVDASAGALAATVATGVLVLNPLTAQWFRIVMTESVFFSTVVIAACAAQRIVSGRSTSRTGSLLTLAALFAAVTRPNGFLIGASILTIVVVTRRSGWKRVVQAGLLWAAAALVLLIALGATGPPSEGSITSQLYQGVVVEGAEHVRTTIRMPAPADASDESLGAAVRYAVNHPVATARLGATRLAMETIQVRRHYPLVVNLGFGLAIFALFGATAVGWNDPRVRPARVVFLSFAIPLMVLTMLTFAVAESRYGWAYLLPLAPIAGVGASRCTHRLLRFSPRRPTAGNGCEKTDRA